MRLFFDIMRRDMSQKRNCSVLLVERERKKETYGAGRVENNL